MVEIRLPLVEEGGYMLLYIIAKARSVKARECLDYPPTASLSLGRR